MPDIFFLIFGIIITQLGFLLIVIEINITVKCRERTTAEITRLKKSTTLLRGSGVNYYSPEFTYIKDDINYFGITPFSTRHKDKYRIGDKITIYINSTDPEQYRLKRINGILIFGFVTLAVGLVFVILYLM